jgi:hypothetical protein
MRKIIGECLPVTPDVAMKRLEVKDETVHKMRSDAFFAFGDWG